MQHLTLKRGRSSSSVHHALLCSLLFAAVTGAELFFCASSANAIGRDFSKKYTLRGDIALTYEERRTNGEGLDLSRFTQSYHLGLSGFAVDPRLMTFDVDTTFSQESSKPEDNINSYSFDTMLSFLNKAAPRGFFSHFPQPIELKFSSYESGNSRGRNYGISLGYDLFESSRAHRQFQQVRRQQQMDQPSDKNAGQPSDENAGPSDENAGQQKQGPVQQQIKLQIQDEKFPFPLPIIYVDYDKTSYSFSNPSNSFKVDTDFLSLRLVDRDINTEYLADYNYHRYKGAVDLTTQFLNIEVNYRDNWEQGNNRFESKNRLYFTDLGDSKTLNLSNKNYWDKRLGTDLKDNLTFTYGGSFIESDVSRSSDLVINARAQYIKNFKKLRNMTSADLGFGSAGADTIYSVRLFDEANYDLSRLLSLGGRVALGRNELGAEFGAGAGLLVRTFINILPNYDFNSIAASEGRTNTHSFSLNMNGPIYKNIILNSRNSYRIREVSGSNPSKEKVLDLRGDVFWVLQWMNINLGASYINVRNSDGGLVEGEAQAQEDIKVTSLYSNLSAPLLKGAFLTLNTTYTKDMKEKTFSIRPIINWNVRLLTLTAEYELRKTSGENDVTDHRIFFRLTRTFSKRLRGFR